jgi:hypothetical protein
MIRAWLHGPHMPLKLTDVHNFLFNIKSTSLFAPIINISQLAPLFSFNTPLLTEMAGHYVIAGKAVPNHVVRTFYFVRFYCCFQMLVLLLAFEKRLRHMHHRRKLRCH